MTCVLAVGTRSAVAWVATASDFPLPATPTLVIRSESSVIAAILGQAQVDLQPQQSAYAALLTRHGGRAQSW